MAHSAKAVRAAGLLLVFLLGACSSGTHVPSPPLPVGSAAHDAELLEGRRLFAANCATCHGTAGGGGLGPSFKDGKLLRDFPDIASQITFVEHGKGVMPAWGTLLPAAQIHAVVRYEREVLSRPSSTSP